MYDLKIAYKVLSAEPTMKMVIAATGKLERLPQRDLFHALLSSIASQQLSAKAGDTIFGRFCALFPGNDPAPEVLVKLKPEKLRLCGLSAAKSGYMVNVAKFKLDGQLEKRALKKLDDEELLLHLTKIKGVGRWTAEMILMFTMHRPDILPLDDVGLQNAMMKLFNKRASGKALRTMMEKKSAPWRPYRTLACRHLWWYGDMET